MKNQSALNQLYENINEDIRNKNMEITRLKKELAKVKKAHFEQQKLKPWLEKKDEEMTNSPRRSLSPMNKTVNSMKFQLTDEKPVSLDYSETYK